MRPQLILHAAAHKHVPLMEANPEEAVVVNAGGTANVLAFAETVGAERFVLISTDKAVAPCSMMGATKKLAELLVRHAQAHHGGTRYMTVRFGNVLGSRGSVVPFFQQRLAKGLPLPITDPEMTRYFMTIKEAALLVIEAMVLGEAGATYILEMGEPVSILELARNLLVLSGFDPENGDDGPGIEIVGLRPGEKRHESLLDDGEVLEPSGNPLIRRAHLPDRRSGRGGRGVARLARARGPGRPGAACAAIWPRSSRSRHSWRPGREAPREPRPSRPSSVARRAGWDAWLETIARRRVRGERLVDATAAARHFPAASRALAHRAATTAVSSADSPPSAGAGSLLRRLESSVEGSPAGPVVDPTLDAATRDAVFAALVAAYAAARRRPDGVRGLHPRAAPAKPRTARASPPAGSGGARRCPTALVDLAGGLAHVEAHVLSNNRRNERNRGLKRGCYAARQQRPRRSRRLVPALPGGGAGLGPGAGAAGLHAGPRAHAARPRVPGPGAPRRRDHRRPLLRPLGRPGARAVRRQPARRRQGALPRDAPLLAGPRRGLRARRRGAGLRRLRRAGGPAPLQATHGHPRGTARAVHLRPARLARRDGGAPALAGPAMTMVRAGTPDPGLAGGPEGGQCAHRPAGREGARAGRAGSLRVDHDHHAGARVGAQRRRGLAAVPLLRRGEVAPRRALAAQALWSAVIAGVLVAGGARDARGRRSGPT